MLVDRHPEEGVRGEIGQVDAVEGLRGVAVCLVVFFHYLAVRDPRAADPFIAWVDSSRTVEVLLRNGHLGVELFFLITGFLLVLPWARHAAAGRPAPRARDFYVRRILRIVPAYYVHLAALFAVFLPIVAGLGFVRDNGSLVAFNAVAHAAFLHYTTPLSSASLNLNGALWTLSLEAQFYLLLPLLAPVFVRAPLRWCAALVVVAAAWRWHASHAMAPAVQAMMEIGRPWNVGEPAVRHLLATQLPGYLGHFAAGMAMGMAWLRLRHRQPARAERLVAAAGVAASLAALYWLYGFAGVGRVGAHAAWLLTLAAIACAFFASLQPGAPRKLVEARPLRLAGRVSYSAYLYHVPLLLLWNRLGLFEASWLSLPAFLASLATLAWLSWRWVEVPFLRSTARRPLPEPALAPPIIAR